jgi:hypothetical protein
MNPGRAVVLAAVGVIVLVTAASGTPLWSVPEQGAGQAPLGEGTASVSVVSAPEQVTLEPGRQGGDVYYLRVPDTEIEVSQLRGNPLVSYSIDIDGLGYSRSSVSALGTVGEGTARLSLSDDALDGNRLEQDEYDGRVRLVLRGNGEEQVLYDQPITIEVRR